MAGPLPLIEADSFAAVNMEAVFQPGMHSPVHRHPGVEVWHTLQGEQCLETPDGKLVQRAARRSLVVILQDATKPRSMLATDWSPVGRCRPWREELDAKETS